MNVLGARWFRLLQVSPLLVALVYHAVSMQRWLLSIPLIVAVLFGLTRSRWISTTSRHWYVSIVLGVALGLVIPAADVSSGPLPPAAAAAMTGVAALLGLLAVFAGQHTVAWAAAWGLLSISGKVELGGAWRWILFAFLLSSLLAMVASVGLLKKTKRDFLVFGLFAGVLAASTFTVAAVLHRIDEVFLKSVESIVSSNSPAATTGLGSSITLSSNSTLTPSQSPVFELSEICGLLRVKVMDQFDGQRWTTSAGMLQANLPQGELFRAGKLNSSLESDASKFRDGDAKQLEMFFLRLMDRSLPAPAGTIGIREVQPKVIGGWIFKGSPEGTSIALTVDAQRGLPKEAYSVGSLLDVPDDLREGLTDIAANIAGKAESNTAKANAIASFLQNNFEYSFSTDLSGEDHPLIVLIRERRPAFCVYFASAMAVMLRTQNVPTRVVTGYVPGEINPVSRRVTVRDRDSHAWVEVWDPANERFVAYDPTPFASRSRAMGHDQSPNLAIAAFAAMRSSFQRWWRVAQVDPLSAAKVMMASPGFWLVLVCATVVYLKQKHQTLTAQDLSAIEPIDRRMQDLYARYQEVLVRAGIEPQTWETDDEVLTRLAETGDEDLSLAAREFLERYRSARFGGGEFREEFAELPIFDLDQSLGV